MGRYPETENFEIEADDGIVRITIDSTSKHNSLNRTMSEELLDVGAHLNADDAARCVVLTGSGGVFCAGGDISGFAADDNRSASTRRGASIFHDAVIAFHRAEVPLVVGVNGVAVGAGLSLAMMGDVVVIHEDAHLAYGYPGVGLPGDGGITFHLPRLVGLRKAKEIALLGGEIDAEEAVELHLATEVAGENFDDRLAELAEEIGSGPTQAFGAAKRLLTDSLDNSIEEQLAAETDAIARGAGSADHEEGVRAFLEGREPEFEGR